MTHAYKITCLPEGYCKLAIAARNYLSDRELFEIEGKLVFTDDLEAYLDDSVGTACCCDVFDSHAECIRLFHSIDISDCPYTNSLDSRLAELDYLLNNDLADVDCENWEEDTPFKDPRELYDFLKTEKPEEELVFSHGDLGDSNIFVKDGKVSGFIDLGRSGRVDKWYDIAFCVRSIREDIGEEQYVELFFDLLGIKPDWEKIKYYILLDELF